VLHNTTSDSSRKPFGGSTLVVTTNSQNFSTWHHNQKASHPSGGQVYTKNQLFIC